MRDRSRLTGCVRRQREHERRPLARPATPPRASPFASAKPRAIARPSPRRARSPRRRRAGTARRSARAPATGCPARGRSTRTSTRLAVSTTCTRTGSSSGEYLSAFSSRFASTRSICRASTRTAGGSVRQRHLDAPPLVAELRRAPARRGRRPARPRARAGPRRPAAGRGRAGCRRARSSRPASPRIVSTSSRSSSSSSSRSGRARALADVRIAISGRTQIVADRAEQRRLDRVAPPQRLRLERLACETLPVDRDAEQRRERRQEAPPGGGPAGLGVARAESSRHACRRPAAGSCRGRSSSAGPSSIVASLGLERCAASGPRSARARRARRRARAARPAISASSADSSARRRERAASSLTTTDVTTKTPSANQFRESAQRERVHRGQEEEVEREHARHRGRDRGRQSREDGDRKHGEQVEDREAQDRDVRLEQPDHHGHRRHERRAGRNAERRPAHSGARRGPAPGGGRERVSKRSHASIIATSRGQPSGACAAPVVHLRR